MEQIENIASSAAENAIDRRGLATAAFVLGLISIIAWLIPILTLPVMIVGLILGILGLKSSRQGLAITGIVLSSIFLILSIGWSVFCGLNYFQTHTKVTLGEMKGTSYTNDYFGLSFSIPGGWTNLDKATIDRLSNAGVDAFADADLKKKYDLGKEKTLNLVWAFKYPLGSDQPYNPGFMCIAENINLVQGLSIKNGKDYLESTKKLMKQTTIPYQFEKEIYVERLGGKEFYVMEAFADAGTMKITQKYYSCKIKNYALNFILSYSSEAELAELKTGLDAVKFN